MNDNLIEKLKKLASSECFFDDEDAIVDDYAGGNVDDAFDAGSHAGEVTLARYILNSMEISWNEA